MIVWQKRSISKDSLAIRKKHTSSKPLHVWPHFYSILKSVCLLSDLTHIKNNNNSQVSVNCTLDNERKVLN